MKAEDWNRVINTNLTGTFNLCKLAVQSMMRQRYGRIITLTSPIGKFGFAGQANYAAAKAGMIGFSKSLAKEFAARSVTVNVVAPGFIETDMTADLDERLREAVLKFIPLKRFGQPEDIAQMAAFLCSEEAGYVTGQVFTVDGGMVM